MSVDGFSDVSASSNGGNSGGDVVWSGELAAGDKISKRSCEGEEGEGIETPFGSGRIRTVQLFQGKLTDTKRLHRFTTSWGRAMKVMSKSLHVLLTLLGKLLGALYSILAKLKRPDRSLTTQFVASEHGFLTL